MDNNNPISIREFWRRKYNEIYKKVRKDVEEINEGKLPKDASYILNGEKDMLSPNIIKLETKHGPIIIKETVCDTDEQIGEASLGQSSLGDFKNEYETFMMLNQFSKLGYPHLATALDVIQIVNKKPKYLMYNNQKYTKIGDKSPTKRNCYVVMPMAIMDAYTLMGSILISSKLKQTEKKQVIINILKQMIISLYLFHKIIKDYHCDTHSKNFFIFNNPYCSSSSYEFENGYKVNTSNLDKIKHDNLIGLDIVLYDFGRLGRASHQRMSSCKVPGYEYYRLFSTNTKSVVQILNDNKSLDNENWGFLGDCWNLLRKSMGDSIINKENKWPDLPKESDIMLLSSSELTSLEESEELAIGLLRILDKEDINNTDPVCNYCLYRKQIKDSK